MAKNKKIKWVAVIGGILIAMSACGSQGSSSSYDSSRGGGTGISNTVDSPSEMEIGDLMAVNLADEGTIDFAGVDSSSKFILIMGNADQSSSSSVQLSADLMAPLNKAMEIEEDNEDLENDNEYGPNEILSAWLRANEAELADYSAPMKAMETDKSFDVSKTNVGTIKTFKVLNSLSSVNETTSVTAKARCVGTNMALYVDTRVSSSILSSEEINEICDNADEAVTQEIELLGEPSDVNNDDLVTVLLTPQINVLGGLGGGIITGYFYAGDLYSGSNSNNQEIVYGLVPDPTGEYGTAISKNFALDNLIPAVIPHEIQHAINYNWHVFRNNGSSESAWLNEGISHLVEELTGYGRENPSRYSIYLANPSKTNLVATGSPSLQERGAAYLFLRFMYEQADDGDAFLKALVDTNKTGVENIESAFNGSDSDFDEFSEFFARWTVALAMTDRGISQDPRFTYSATYENSATGNMNGVLLSGEPNDGRGTSLDGIHLTNYSGYHRNTVYASASKFFQISSVPETIELTPDGANDFAILIRTE